MKIVFRQKSDHLYTLPSAEELRERYEGAMMRAETLENQLRGFEKFKKTMRARFDLTFIPGSVS